MSDPAERVFVDVFTDYQRELQRANAFDFDDLIGQTVYLFRAFPQVADVYRRRFRHILVDEYQDTNHAQYALIHELTLPVGSDAKPFAGSGGMMIFDAPTGSATGVGDNAESVNSPPRLQRRVVLACPTIDQMIRPQTLAVMRASTLHGKGGAGIASGGREPL